MFLSCVHVKVKPEYIRDFIEETRINHIGSIKEPGNLRFDVLQQANDPAVFLLYEAWDNDQAALDHKGTEHYKRWKEKVEAWMAEPRQGIRYNILYPEQAKAWKLLSE